MSTIQVEIVSAEEAIWSGEGAMVFAPGDFRGAGASRPGTRR